VTIWFVAFHITCTRAALGRGRSRWYRPGGPLCRVPVLTVVHLPTITLSGSGPPALRGNMPESRLPGPTIDLGNTRCKCVSLYDKSPHPQGVTFVSARVSPARRSGLRTTLPRFCGGELNDRSMSSRVEPCGSARHERARRPTPARPRSSRGRSSLRQVVATPTPQPRDAADQRDERHRGTHDGSAPVTTRLLVKPVHLVSFSLDTDVARCGPPRPAGGATEDGQAAFVHYDATVWHPVLLQR
jgi:hypothetical protein